ncbi:MAG: YARHG domain-containing protein [Bacteroidota bacterium]|nr:YARHG domain-containing protein [Bacteroidota bacterium]
MKSQNPVNTKSTNSNRSNKSANSLKYFIDKCKENDSFILSEEELAELNSKEKKLLRNFFFAKHGYSFKDEELKIYFKQYAWYKPLKKKVDSLLNYYDKENLDLIKLVEAEKFIKSANQSTYCETLNGCWQYGNTAVGSGYEDRFVFNNSDKSFVMYTNQMDGKNNLLSYSGFFTLGKNKIELEIRTKVFLEPKTNKEKVKNLEEAYDYKTVIVDDIVTYVNRDGITKTYFKINGRVYWKYSSDLESCH